MIRALRSRHRILWLLLAVLLPLMMLAAWRARRPPATSEIPQALERYTVPADDVSPDRR